MVFPATLIPPPSIMGEGADTEPFEEATESHAKTPGQPDERAEMIETVLQMGGIAEDTE